jgi:hypothetical protein
VALGTHPEAARTATVSIAASAKCKLLNGLGTGWR